ncbi:TPA: hypothetical protein KEW36_000160 [Proteus mirabilis]|uniref:hypothetical protein n=1 Tax=Proteus mirabilis TaxID=584 RepID=UPI00073C8435|nr:hypothetical protein [Proteus mirabilis]EMA1123015.1 hypothetical protein [Proteus mirabilis]KSW20443.1 hypothetical protein OJ22_05480 [Proteus mirabilis]MBI6274746.1 hypothetical protein [Proteus mirabilis]MBI6520026.1 hypothetical protein [Proteus mirabilis]MDM3689980.1 hypothetical protein [Proteus mirabilis]
MKMKYLPFFILLMTIGTTLSYATDGEIKIMAGKTGYVGEVIPVTKLAETFPKSFTAPSSANYYARLGFLSLTNQTGYCGSTDGLQKIPEINEWGFKLINKNYPTSGYLLLAINGNIGGQYKTNNSGIQNIKGVLTRSKLTRSSLYNVSKNGSFCWGPSAYDQENFYDPSFRSYVSISINSYSVYAYGDIKPGIFSLETSFKLSRNTANSVDDSTAYFIRPGEIKVTALRSCNVTSSTETNIKFKDQFTSTFTSPTLLDTSPVNSVNVTCTQGGKNYITIKAYNSLVSGNMSGMLLNGTKSNNQSEVYVVASLKNLTNQTCQANDTSAIRFFDGHYIPNMDNIKSFNQTFLFGLCANGKVIADKYSGAVDVSFIVE